MGIRIHKDMCGEASEEAIAIIQVINSGSREGEKWMDQRHILVVNQKPKCRWFYMWKKKERN